MENWFNVEYVFSKTLHITPTELDKMDFYRVEYLIMKYEEDMANQEKEANEQQKQISSSSESQKASFNKNQYNMKPPKLEMPKMKMPSFNTKK